MPLALIPDYDLFQEVCLYDRQQRNKATSLSYESLNCSTVSK